MPRIDTTDCWLEIGVGPKFTRTLVWVFARFLRENLPALPTGAALAAEAVDREARRLANQFIFDMQEYFRATLGDTLEDLEHMSAEGIVDIYLDENLEDFQTDYLRQRLAAFSSACGHLATPVATPDQTAVVAVATCH